MEAGIAVYRYGLKVQAFVFPRTKHTVRIIIDKNGNPWWVAKDVCEVLGHSDVSMAISRLDEGEKGASIVCTPGGKQKMAVINESGLYSLIMTSRKPEAKAFKKWVTSEVLPTIRKTGSYGHNSQPQFDPSDPAQLLPCLLKYTQGTIQLEAEKAKLETRLEAQTPVVKAIKRLAASEGSVCIQDPAKALKLRPKDLTNRMLKTGWLYMRPPARLPTSQKSNRVGWNARR